MEYRNPKWQYGNSIDCEINHPNFGWIPFTAVLTDLGAEFDVVELYTRMSKDKSILPYTPQSLALNLEQLANQIRTERNQLLAESDWTQIPDAPVDQAAWKLYRQELRDITDQAGFPTTIVWPVKP